ncbi:hypothetical protein [Paenibacillus sp. HJGM_3]|uniref:hypothetical protein n=1 Tax=Paenibacillus sp. HJGM_3 TaxID=3379816 RepID=UPI0038592365
MVLTEHQARVFDAIKQGSGEVSKSELIRLLQRYGVSDYHIQRTVEVLIDKQAIARVRKGVYKALAQTYLIAEPAREQAESITINTTIPRGKMLYIVNNYGKFPRSELARRAGISKLVLNQVLLEQGLGV